MDKKETKKTTNNKRAYSAESAESAESSKKIIKDFMKGLMTTDELIKKNKDRGQVKIRLDLSLKEFNKMKPENLINIEFDSTVKNILKNKNKKIFNFVSKRAINFGKK
jgi:hypothetical protein